MFVNNSTQIQNRHCLPFSSIHRPGTPNQLPAPPASISSPARPGQPADREFVPSITHNPVNRPVGQSSVSVSLLRPCPAAGIFCLTCRHIPARPAQPTGADRRRRGGRMWRSGCIRARRALPPPRHSLVASGNVFFPGGRVGGAAGRQAGRLGGQGRDGSPLLSPLGSASRTNGGTNGLPRLAGVWLGGWLRTGMISRSLSLGWTVSGPDVLESGNQPSPPRLVSSYVLSLGRSSRRR